MQPSAKDAVETIDQLTAMHYKNSAIIETLGRSAKTAGRIFTYLESNPIIDITKTAFFLGLSYNAVAGAVEKLIGCGILVQISNATRNRTFAYDEYLQILRKDT